MSKKTVKSDAAAPVALYQLSAKGQKMGCRATTKWPAPTEGNVNSEGATGGNLATLQAIAALGATFTLAQYRDACAARDHKGFAAYGLRNKWVELVA